MVMAKTKFRVERNIKIASIIKVQKIYKSLVLRRKFRDLVKIHKNKHALIIQRFTKGYKQWKKYKEIIHRIKIDALMVHFRALKLVMHTNSQIKIRYYWKKYLKNKAIKAAKKKAQDEKNAKLKLMGKLPKKSLTKPVIVAPSPTKKPTVIAPATFTSAAETGKISGSV